MNPRFTTPEVDQSVRGLNQTLDHPGVVALQPPAITQTAYPGPGSHSYLPLPTFVPEPVYPAYMPGKETSYFHLRTPLPAADPHTTITTTTSDFLTTTTSIITRPVLSPSPPASLIRPLGYRAAMIRSDSRVEQTNPVTLPPQKSLVSAHGPRIRGSERARLYAAYDEGGVTAALAARNANRSTNGDDSHNSGTGVRRTERAARECTYTDFLKFQPLNFKGTEGVAGLSQWFERMSLVEHSLSRQLVHGPAYYGP
ncbi:hypothetical protein Tco_0614848 [Tanacetum coccineum]